MNVCLQEKETNTKTKLADRLISNIQLLLVKNRISVSELARQVDIPKSTVHKLLAGKITNPSIRVIEAIAHFFDVSIDALLSYTTEHIEQNTVKPTFVPLIDWENLGDIKTLTFNHWEHWQPVPLQKNEQLDKATFALKSLPSMYPRYPNSTTLIIDPVMRPESGDIVLFKSLETNDFGLREILIDPPQIQLKSLFSNNLTAIDKTDLYEIIGTVIMSIYKK